jgi:hypothetical protein
VNDLHVGPGCDHSHPQRRQRVRQPATASKGLSFYSSRTKRLDESTRPTESDDSEAGA